MIEAGSHAGIIPAELVSKPRAGVADWETPSI